MNNKKHNIGMLFAGLVLVGGASLFVKTNLVPILTGLSVAEIIALPMSDLLKIFEVAAVIIVTAGLILQELVTITISLSQIRENSDNPDKRWKNLGYVAVVIFGSAALYEGTSHILGW